jgi:hypothetical protein
LYPPPLGVDCGAAWGVWWGCGDGPGSSWAASANVEKQFIRLIHREAEAEGVSITEVVNRAFKKYFDKKIVRGRSIHLAKGNSAVRHE